MKEDMKNFMEAVWKNHRGKFIGTMIGLFIGLSVLVFGFFKTLFVLFCAAIGFYIGGKVDNQEDLIRFLEKLIPSRFR